MAKRERENEGEENCNEYLLPLLLFHFPIHRRGLLPDENSALITYLTGAVMR